MKRESIMNDVQKRMKREKVQLNRLHKHPSTTLSESTHVANGYEECPVTHSRLYNDSMTMTDDIMMDEATAYHHRSTRSDTTRILLASDDTIDSRRSNSDCNSLDYPIDGERMFTTHPENDGVNSQHRYRRYRHLSDYYSDNDRNQQIPDTLSPNSSSSSTASQSSPTSCPSRDSSVELSPASYHHKEQISSSDLVFEAIIASEYTPFAFRISNECSELNELEKAKINELMHSSSFCFVPIECKSTPHPETLLKDLSTIMDAYVRNFIKWCKRLTNFRSLCMKDQISLLKGGCIEFMTMKAASSFKPELDEWQVNLIFLLLLIQILFV